MAAPPDASQRGSELARYVLNGLLATGVHYAVLTLNLKVLHVPSAGVANFMAAIVGVATSFLGSRYFVFQARHAPLGTQAVRFVALYACIAALHGLLLFGWTDVLNQNYSIGFLLATGMQMAISYVGNKYLVFSR